MRPDSNPPSAGATPGGEPAPSGTPAWADGDPGLALVLYTMWAARTGRSLRAVPVADLTAEELVEFWADDQLGQPPAAPPR